MAYNFIDFRTEDCCAYIVLNKRESLNALNRKFLEEIDAAVSSINSESIKCLVIKSNCDKAFAAGADIKEMIEFSKEQAKEYSFFGKRVFNDIARLNIPTIALINGYALGGGCELALACDIRISSHKSKFGFPEVGLGIFPGFDGINRLKKIVGESLAKSLVFTGSIIDAEYANSIHLTNYLFGDETFENEANKVIQTILNQPIQSLQSIKTVFLKIEDSVGYFDDSLIFGDCFGEEAQLTRMGKFIER